MSKSSEQRPEAATHDTRVVLGRVRRPHGVRGAVLVDIDPSLSGALTRGQTLHLQFEDGTERDVTVDAAPAHGTTTRLSLREIADREEAGTLRGATLSAAREDLPPLEEGEYYDEDLIGCTVETVKGKELGRLAEIVVTGANDVYVVACERGEVLVPAVDGIVLEIDIDGRRVVVEPSGLEYSGLAD